MDLGSLSVSIAVKDLAASKDFYEKPGWDQCGNELDSLTDVREITLGLGVQMAVGQNHGIVGLNHHVASGPTSAPFEYLSNRSPVCISFSIRPSL